MTFAVMAVLSAALSSRACAGPLSMSAKLAQVRGLREYLVRVAAEHRPRHDEADGVVFI